MNVLDLLQSTTAYFAKRGVESPRLNIEHLLAHTLGKKRIELYMEFDRPLGEQELKPLRELVRRRAEGEPLQHLLGTVEFFGREFRCDSRALIPRPETEQLVELTLAIFKKKFANDECNEPISDESSDAESANDELANSEVANAEADQNQSAKKNKTSPLAKTELRVLDVGTGSGVIALTLAAELPKSRVEAVDVSSDALALARENAEKLAVGESENRVRFYESNLLEDAEGNYDLIIANLPYIPAGEIASLAREVQRDPLLALDGGAVGTEILERLIADANRHLAPGGLLALEIGHDQTEPLTAILKRENFQKIRAERDYQEISRYLFADHG